MKPKEYNSGGAAPEAERNDNLDARFITRDHAGNRL
jgi:hypothetical protein